MAVKLFLSQERKERLNKELSRIVTNLKEAGVKKIILYGSLVKGDIRSTSDIDLIVIKDTNKRFLKRLESFYAQFVPSVAVDILCYTPQEVEELKEESFMKKVFSEGRVLYEAGRCS